MKANTIKIVLGLIFLVVFNALFFLLGDASHSTTDWVCYGFIHVAYLCLLATPLLCQTKKGEFVLSASLYLRALCYFFTELVVGLAFIFYNAYNPISHSWPTIIQALLLAVFLILQLLSVWANDATKGSLAKQRQERVYIRTLAEKLHGAMQQVNDPALRKQLTDCYESLSQSSIETFPEAAEAEAVLEKAVNTLCALVQKGETAGLAEQIQQLQDAMKQRNQAVRKARFSE